MTGEYQRDTEKMKQSSDERIAAYGRLRGLIGNGFLAHVTAETLAGASREAILDDLMHFAAIERGLALSVSAIACSPEKLRQRAAWSAANYAEWVLWGAEARSMKSKDTP